MSHTHGVSKILVIGKHEYHQNETLIRSINHYNSLPEGPFDLALVLGADTNNFTSDLRQSEPIQDTNISPAIPTYFQKHSPIFIGKNLDMANVVAVQSPITLKNGLCISCEDSGNFSLSSVNSSFRYSFIAGDHYHVVNDSAKKLKIIHLGNFAGDNKHIFAFKFHENESKNEESAVNNEDPIWVPPSLDRKRKTEVVSADQTTNLEKRQRRNSSVDTAKCFFCLSNPNIDKNLIVSIGKANYMALAKGPLCSALAKEKLGCSGHVILIPFEHVSFYSDIGTGDTKKQAIYENTMTELRTYCNSLEELYKSKGLQMGGFEISRTRKGVHIHRQVLPLAHGELTWKQVKAYVDSESGATGLNFVETQEELLTFDDYVLMFVGSHRVVAKITPNQRIDVHMCRRIFALATDEPNQSDWRRCIQSTEEEQQDRARFCEVFKGFNISS